MLSFEYEWNDILLDIEYIYDPGEPDQWYDSNGDPGTPGYGPTVEIQHVWALMGDRNKHKIDVDIQELIDVDLESIILESHE
jgi:hypothetical protein